MHKSRHPFTGMIRLGAKEPDHLAKCNTEESDQCCVFSILALEKGKRNTYMQAIANPTNIEPSTLAGLPPSFSTDIGVANLLQNYLKLLTARNKGNELPA